MEKEIIPEYLAVRAPFVIPQCRYAGYKGAIRHTRLAIPRIETLRGDERGNCCSLTQLSHNVKLFRYEAFIFCYTISTI